MSWRRKTERLCWLAVLALLSGICSALSAQAQEGRTLFAGNASVTKGRACKSCHGRDGEGLFDGGVQTPAIKRGQNSGLERPRVLSEGRLRPAYNLSTFGRALLEGKDSAGNTLSDVMPRYDLSPDQAGSLWEYLKELDQRQSQGVSDSTISFAVVGPLGSDAGLNEIAGKLTAAFRDRPQFFGRKVVFQPVTWSPATPACPGAGQLAVVLPVEAPGGALFTAADDCDLPVLAPLRPLIGLEDPTIVRSTVAALSDQWRALLQQMPEPHAIAETTDLTAEEREAVELILRGSAVTLPKAKSVIAPFGLNRSVPSRTLVVAAPADNSSAAIQTWRKVTHEVLIAVSTPDDGGAGGTLDRRVEIFAAILEKALIAAGPALTRASLMRAVDTVVVQEPGWHLLEYPRFKLTGTRSVEILRVKGLEAR
jgi:hypothetical protein